MKSESCQSVIQVEDGINKHQFFRSVRMIYSICAFIAMTLHLFMRNTLNLTVLYMAESLFWTRQQAISLLGYFYIGYIITLPIAGQLADSYGGKHFFVHSVVFQAIIFLLIPLFGSINYWLVTALIIIQGLVSGFGSPSIYQLFTVWAHPKERTALLSFGFSGFSFGSLLIYPITGFFSLFGWEYVFYGIGIPSLLSGVAFNWLVYSSLEDHPHITEHEYNYLRAGEQKNIKRRIPWKSIFTSQPIYAFIITHVLHTYGVLLFNIMIPRMLQEAMGFSLNEVSLYSSVYSLGAFISKMTTILVFSYLEAKIVIDIGRLRRFLYIIFNCITIALITTIILLNSGYKITVVIITFFVGISTDVSFSAAYWPTLLYLAPSYAGLLSGLANCLATTTGFLVPLITSHIIENGSKDEWNIVLYTMILSYAIAAAIYGTFGSSKLLKWDNPLVNDKSKPHQNSDILESKL